MIPSWVVSAVATLGKSIVDLVGAKDDAERKEVLMRTQEDIKAHLDAEKFG